VESTLWRHRDFDLLWAGQTVSRVGTEVSTLAIPLIAIQLLHATTFEVGVLTAVEFLPFLLVGLPAGAWVDRARKRRVLVLADAGRLVALASIPIASALASVTLAQLFVAAFVTGVLTVFFDVAYQSYLPELVGVDHLVEGNAKLTATESAAHVVGPGVAGALVGAVGAVTAVVADAASYAVSFVCVVLIRAPSERPARAAGEHTSLVHDIREGLRFVWHEHRIRAVAFCTATSNLFSAMGTAVLILLMSRALGFGGGEIGLVFALGGLGGLVGAVLAPRLAEWLGLGKAIVWSIGLGGIGPALIALATGQVAFALLAVGIAIQGGTSAAYNINQVSIRQAICPPRLLGRMNASVRFLVWGTLPIGGFAGGVLGSLFGLRTTLWISAIGQAGAFLWLLPSPVPQMRTIPRPMTDGPAADGPTPEGPTPEGPTPEGPTPEGPVTEPILGTTVEAPTA
jgi:MFS family permease